MKQSQFTGELWLHSTQCKWVIYFYLGRVLYATGGRHPLRRWRRQVYLFFPEVAGKLMAKVNTVIAQSSTICWEYDLLCLFRNKELINREELLKMIKQQVTEILFDLTQSKQIIYELKERKINPLNNILIDPNDVVVEGWKLWQHWQTARIADRSPDTSPIITQPEQLQSRTSPKTYQALQKLLADKLSLRELAMQIDQDVVQLVRLLIPYIQQGLIELVDIHDLTIVNNPKNQIKKQLIISIFENKVFNEHLEPLLKDTGYYYLNISNGLETVADLIQLKPDLLFLEWQMIKNGGSQFKSNLTKLKEELNKPIFLFTEKTGFLEEIQAKSTGCDRLIYLPIIPDTFLNLIQRYLP
mgnify:CR=1 FL=1